MAKLSLEDLRALRAKMKILLERRDPEGKDIQIIVGMGTCGIAAGAKNTLMLLSMKLMKKVWLNKLSFVNQDVWGCVAKNLQ